MTHAEEIRLWAREYTAKLTNGELLQVYFCLEAVRQEKTFDQVVRAQGLGRYFDDVAPRGLDPRSWGEIGEEPSDEICAELEEMDPEDLEILEGQVENQMGWRASAVGKLRHPASSSTLEEIVAAFKKTAIAAPDGGIYELPRFEYRGPTT